MELSSFQIVIERQFDTFSKRLLKNEARNFYNELTVKRSHEVLFSEMPKGELEALKATDKYPSDIEHFIVNGFEVVIENDLLANALYALPEQSRNIVLMAYFLKMTDREIAETLKMVRQTVQYQRTTSLNKMKKHMGGKSNGKE